MKLAVTGDADMLVPLDSQYPASGIAIFKSPPVVVSTRRYGKARKTHYTADTAMALRLGHET